MLGIRLRSSVAVGLEVSTLICMLLADKIVVLSGFGGTVGNKHLDRMPTGYRTEVIGV